MMADRRFHPGLRIADWRRRLTIVVVTATLVGLAWEAPESRAPFEIRTLSSRADLVSGGDALVAITVPAGTKAGQLNVALNGKDITARFTLDAATGEYRGVVEGLALGANRIIATTKSPRAEAGLSITNHPISGPILSGPHLTPFECSTEASGLGPALDANCSAPSKTSRFYRTTANAFKPFDPTAPPADVATTTTTDGKSVPYIVRVDSGVINRAIYQLAILDDLSHWNRKFVVSFGGSSGTQYIQGVMAPPPGGGVLNHQALSKGFGYLISSELVNGRRGNGVLQGETLMMIKESIIERYGVPKFFVGSGGSGGAIQQLVITQMYPRSEERRVGKECRSRE